MYENLEKKASEAVKKFGGPENIEEVVEIKPNFIAVKSRRDERTRTDFYNDGKIDCSYYKLIAGENKEITNRLSGINSEDNLRITLIEAGGELIISTFSKEENEYKINVAERRNTSSMNLGTDFEKAKKDYEFLISSIDAIL